MIDTFNNLFFDYRNTIVFFVLLFNLFFLIVVLLKKQNNFPKLFYVMHLVCVIGWIGSLFFFRASLDSRNIIFFAKGLYIFPFLIPIFFNAFLLINYKDLFASVSSLKIFRYSLVSSLYVFFIPKTIASYHYYNGTKMIDFNFTYNLIYNILLVGNFSILFYILWFWSRKAVTEKERKQGTFIFWGNFIATFISLVTNMLLPTFGNHVYNWIGPTSIIFLTSFTLYAILRYKFFDIKVLGSKFIKYFLFSLYSYVIFYSLVFIYIKSFGSAFSKESYFLGIFAAPLFVYCLFKIENIANWLNKKIFGNLFIHKDVLNDLTLFMGENLDRQEIVEKVEKTLGEFLDSKVEILDNGIKASFTEVAKVQINKNQILYLAEKQDKDFFSKDDISLVSNVVTQLAFALERSELYARVANYATDLEKEVAMKTVELKTANDSLIDLLKNKEEVLRIINHQLNTPISVIKSTAGMVRDGIWNMQKFYDITLKEMASMETILKDFWEAQDARDIKSKLKLQKISFSDLVKSILEEKKLNEKVSIGQIKLVPGVEFSQKSFTLPMDKSEIEQVVSNYIENALFYTKQGEIHINCDDSQLGKIIFSVKDTGMGSSPEMLPKLFGKFVRSKNAELARPSGSGLGLYICKKIIEAHGGRVWAESPGEGLGATFYFELPTNI